VVILLRQNFQLLKSKAINPQVIIQIIIFIIKFSNIIFEIEVELEDKLEIGEKKEDKGNYGNKPGSGKNRLLQHLNTHIAVGTEVLRQQKNIQFIILF